MREDAVAQLAERLNTVAGTTSFGVTAVRAIAAWFSSFIVRRSRPHLHRARRQVLRELLGFRRTADARVDVVLEHETRAATLRGAAQQQPRRQQAAVGVGARRGGDVGRALAVRACAHYISLTRTPVAACARSPFGRPSASPT